MLVSRSRLITIVNECRLRRRPKGGELRKKTLIKTTIHLVCMNKFQKVLKDVVISTGLLLIHLGSIILAIFLSLYFKIPWIAGIPSFILGLSGIIFKVTIFGGFGGYVSKIFKDEEAIQSGILHIVIGIISIGAMFFFLN